MRRELIILYIHSNMVKKEKKKEPRFASQDMFKNIYAMVIGASLYIGSNSNKHVITQK